MLGTLLAPLLSVFAILSVVLSAMQVELAVLAVPGAATDHRWDAFSSVSRWSSVVTLVVAALAISWLASFLLFMFIHETLHARRTLSSKQRHQTRGWRYEKSGAIWRLLLL